MLITNASQFLMPFPMPFPGRAEADPATPGPAPIEPGRRPFDRGAGGVRRKRGGVAGATDPATGKFLSKGTI